MKLAEGSVAVSRGTTIHSMTKTPNRTARMIDDCARVIKGCTTQWEVIPLLSARWYAALLQLSLGARHRGDDGRAKRRRGDHATIHRWALEDSAGIGPVFLAMRPVGSSRRNG
jgi:hypothetical protein